MEADTYGGSVEHLLCLKHCWQTVVYLLLLLPRLPPSTHTYTHTHTPIHAYTEGQEFQLENYINLRKIFAGIIAAALLPSILELETGRSADRVRVALLMKR